MKLQPGLEHGAVHLFKHLQYATEIQLTRKEREVEYARISHNSYFGHPESVILAKLGTYLTQ